VSVAFSVSSFQHAVVVLAVHSQMAPRPKKAAAKPKAAIIKDKPEGATPAASALALANVPPEQKNAVVVGESGIIAYAPAVSGLPRDMSFHRKRAVI
jgi:hypothetical protein